MLIIIMGLPGSGKTTFARRLAEQMGADHLNSDRVRLDMGKRASYTPADKTVVYEELFRRTEVCLQRNQDVIVDSTFYTKNIREPYFQLAKKYRTALKLIVIKAEETTLKQRLQKPRPDSEADYAVYLKIKASYESPEEERLELWSDKMSMEELLQRAMGYIDE